MGAALLLIMGLFLIGSGISLILFDNRTDKGIGLVLSGIALHVALIAVAVLKLIPNGR